MSTSKYNAVLFDLGGVVFESPIANIHAYEDKLGLPRHTFAKVIAKKGFLGSFERLERGEITSNEFIKLFEEECKENGVIDVSGKEFFRVLENVKPRPEWISAIRKIREAGLKTAAITNNWRKEGKESVIAQYFIKNPQGPLFDAIIESSRVGVRKPDPKIYHMALETLNLDPTKCIFLDDLGQNLKTAQQLGIRTIKVQLKNHYAALEELQSLLPFPILERKHNAKL